MAKIEEDLLEARRRELGDGVLDSARGRGVEFARDDDRDLIAVGDDRYGGPRVRPTSATTAMTLPSGSELKEGVANVCSYVRARTTAEESATTVLE